MYAVILMMATVGQYGGGPAPGPNVARAAQAIGLSVSSVSSVPFGMPLFQAGSGWGFVQTGPTLWPNIQPTGYYKVPRGIPGVGNPGS